MSATLVLRQPLVVLHLDDRVVVVDKPPGLLVHKTRTGSDEDALLQRLRDQLGRRLYPVQRLDRMASGLIAYGLDSRAATTAQPGGTPSTATATSAAIPR